MKLLCDVCENAVASLICCADEAALCSSCDARVHAANKLASKHQRMPLLSDASEPVVCDICQERPSFFFCIEDRALLCRDCDVSIHSANALAAKHRRFLLTRLQVGVGSSSSPSQETTSAISLEQSDTMPLHSTAIAVMKPGKQAVTATAVDGGSDGGGSCKVDDMSKRPSKKQALTNTTVNGSKNDGSIARTEGSEKANMASVPAAMSAKALRSYLTSKKGTLSSLENTVHRKEATDTTASNSTTISIQRISAGKMPFVAPVLSTLRAALMQEEASNTLYDHISDIKGNISDNINEDNTFHNVMMDVDDGPALQSDNVSDYLVSGIPGWRLDELLTDLVGVCESGSTLSPPKESNALGLGTQEDPPWYADLDALEEHDLSPSQEKGVALVPETPSPPTASGLVTSRGKPTCPAAQPWAFEYLFTDPHHSNEFSVVPDIDGRRSSPLSTASPTKDSIKKKRKFWLED